MIGYFRKTGVSESVAEDAAQQSLAEFAVAYARGAYDRRKGRLRDWLFGIARNQLSSVRRAAARAQGRPDAAAASEGLDDPSEVVWQEQWRQHALRGCFEQLTQEVALESLEAFRLFCLQGVPAAQVAALLGMTENAVYLNKRRLLRRIRELLDQLDDEGSDARGQETA